MRHQFLILDRGRKRAPNPRATDRIIALSTVFIQPARSPFRYCSEIFHSAALPQRAGKRKYRILFSHERWCRPGPKGPDKDLIDAVVAM